MNRTPQSLARHLFLLMLVFLPTAACLGAEDAKRPDRNVIFFITDDESPTLGCYGDPIAKTPNIDKLAADGTVFLNAFATTASCSASRSVVMTGLHNHMNGQYGHTHHFHKFSSYHDVVSLALPRLMADAGYRTARCGKYHVAPEAVFHFEKTIPANERSTVEMAENCREFITENSEHPFFLYFATSDPHRGGGVDKTSSLELKPNLFGNKPNKKAYPGVDEVFYDPAEVPIPEFLPDTPDTREELAQYYQSVSRIDQGLGRLVEILKENGLYDKTMIVFTADHGMAFSGGKTTVYEGGLRVPFVVRDPYEKNRGVKTEAMISHVDITPSLLDFAGALDREAHRPKNPINANAFWKKRGEALQENRSGGNKFNEYHGRSWIPLLGDPEATTHDSIFASHTFHEIQMYYPMRVYRDKRFKLIWNIAHKLDYPFASDLWAASSWQAQYQKGEDAPYGTRTVGEYIHRPEFELFNMETDPHESLNLANDPAYAEVLEQYKAKLKAKQKELDDPWIMKWDYQ